MKCSSVNYKHKCDRGIVSHQKQSFPADIILLESLWFQATPNTAWSPCYKIFSHFVNSGHRLPLNVNISAWYRRILWFSYVTPTSIKLYKGKSFIYWRCYGFEHKSIAIWSALTHTLPSEYLQSACNLYFDKICKVIQTHYIPYIFTID